MPRATCSRCAPWRAPSTPSAGPSVPVIPLKGMALAESLYGDAGLRVSSDIDLLVPREAVAQAFAVLAQLGYSPAAEETPVEDGDIDLLLESNMEYVFVTPENRACPVELHWDIAWRWPGNARALADLWADARPRRFRGVEAWALGPEWELLYLAVHAARHRWQGLKWLVDVHEICARDGLDWVRVRDKAARFGLGDVLGITLGACRALFGTPMAAEALAQTPPAWLDLFPSEARAPGASGGVPSIRRVCSSGPPRSSAIWRASC